MTRVFIWKNNSPQEWEEISFSAFSKARRNGCFTGRFFIETTENVDGHNERVITECSQARYKTHRQELGTINQDVVHTNSPQRHDTYVYYFADGSRSTLVLGADDMKVIPIQLTQVSQVRDFVNLTVKYPFDIDLVSGRYTVDAKSLLGIYSLDLSTPLKVVIYSDDTAQLEAELAPFTV